MKTVQIYIHPDLTDNFLKIDSPSLYYFLQERKIKKSYHQYEVGGMQKIINNLPKAEKNTLILFRLSIVFYSFWPEIALACYQNGLIPFNNEDLITIEGKQVGKQALLEAIKKKLKK